LDESCFAQFRSNMALIDHYMQLQGCVQDRLNHLEAALSKVQRVLKGRFACCG